MKQRRKEKRRRKRTAGRNRRGRHQTCDALVAVVVVLNDLVHERGKDNVRLLIASVDANACRGKATEEQRVRGTTAKRVCLEELRGQYGPESWLSMPD